LVVRAESAAKNHKRPALPDSAINDSGAINLDHDSASIGGKTQRFQASRHPRQSVNQQRPGLCRVHLSGTVDPTVESLALSDERSRSWET
jgi:hypothetical protein